MVYANLCGPFSATSLRGNRYFLILVDEFTRKIWLYLLKEKKKAFYHFNKFCILVERQSEWRVKILRTNGGREFKSREFAEFCEKVLNMR